MSALAQLRQLDCSTPEATQQSIARLVQELDELFDALERSNRVMSGKLSPEGRVAAPIGTLFARVDGRASATFYVKESGGGSTGWVAK